MRFCAVQFTPGLKNPLNLKSIYEAEFIELLAKGDSEAFQLVFDRYQTQIFATALSVLKNREQARKVVEKVFTDVWEDRSSFRQMQYLESYVLTRARNYTLNLFRLG
jgi:RNA polymerase sigma-70 factor (ECF subfamily)